MKQKGFTLVELLVAIGIIGILSSIAVVSVSNVRVKARDAKRIADVKQIQTGLEAYMNDESQYPIMSADTEKLGEKAAAALCVGAVTKGFQVKPTADAPCDTVYMNPVPANPKPNGADYKYTSEDGAKAACDAGKLCVSYKIIFKLESSAGTFTRGTYEANENGIVRTGDY